MGYLLLVWHVSIKSLFTWWCRRFGIEVINRNTERCSDSGIVLDVKLTNWCITNRHIITKVNTQLVSLPSDEIRKKKSLARKAAIHVHELQYVVPIHISWAISKEWS